MSKKTHIAMFLSAFSCGIFATGFLLRSIPAILIAGLIAFVGIVVINPEK